MLYSFGLLCFLAYCTLSVRPQTGKTVLDSYRIINISTFVPDQFFPSTLVGLLDKQLWYSFRVVIIQGFLTYYQRNDLIQVAVVEYHVSQHMEVLVQWIMSNMTSVVANYNCTCVAGCGSGDRDWGRWGGMDRGWFWEYTDPTQQSHWPSYFLHMLLVIIFILPPFTSQVIPAVNELRLGAIFTWDGKGSRSTLLFERLTTHCQTLALNSQVTPGTAQGQRLHL